MIRLVLLVVATLVGLYAAMAVLGAGNQRVAQRPVASVPTQSAALDAGRPTTLTASGAVTTASTDRAADDADGADAEIVQATGQTPERVQRFPGPPLRPSPEHASRSADGTAAAPSPPPGASGPLRYVTGSRVNMRAGPSTGDRVIGALEGGAAVEAMGPTDGAWVNIRDARGRLGYVSAQFLSETPPR